MMFGQCGCCELPGLGSACSSCGKNPPTLVCSHGVLCISQRFASCNSPGDDFTRIAKQVFLTAFSDEASEGQEVSGAVSPRTG